MFTNNLTLTDDELSAIMTALDFTIMSHESYVKVNGTSKLDIVTLNAYKELKEVRSKLGSMFYNSTKG